MVGLFRIIGECLSGNGTLTFSIVSHLEGLGDGRARTHCFRWDSEERLAGFLKLIFCDWIWLLHVRIQFLNPPGVGTRFYKAAIF
jgi:hypothetical protein